MANLQGPLVNNFEVPSWAGKPPPGLHLDVTKDGKMVQKLMIDEKKCYFFGRNKHLCDFVIDHASCSRVHSALIWHKHLNRPFIIDLGSTHGTYIGTIRLDSKKPQAVPIDSEIHFGASTRRYTIRERPQTGISVLDDGEGDGTTEMEGNLFGLPETERELDNLTEFNTAHNRRVAQMVDLPDTPKNPLKRKRTASMRVRFNEEEDVINPEDIDPTIGRFRNLVQTSVVPTKKMRAAEGGGILPESITRPVGTSLYDDLPVSHDTFAMPTPGMYSIAAKLGLPIPNLAPDIELMPQVQPTALPKQVPMQVHDQNAAKEPRKKKYAKEAWPGRRPGPGLLV